MNEQSIENICPKAIFSSSETLDKRSKALIASAMNAATCDILGCNEMGDIAWECPANEGYHLNDDVVIMEFLDEKDKPVQPGQAGRLVCTSLYGYTMPLIRYDLGDICVPSDRMCSCGRTLPLMESVKGRANDFILLPDGKLISPDFLVIIMQDFHEIVQYKVIQEQKDSILIQIVKGKGYNEITERRILEEIEKVLHNRLDVRVEPVQQVSRDPSGKVRTVVSRVLPDSVSESN
jgi:phenylacetate-CoA ligase